MAWTTPKTWASGYVVLAADLNTHLRDNLNVTAPAVMTTAGDIIYASGANTPARLAKSTTSTQYLANTGTSNIPAWNEVALATGVSGTLPVGNGGIGATTLTANGAVIGNGSSALTSVDMSTKGGILVGDGSGNPRVLPVGGTQDFVLTVDSGETTGMKWAAGGGTSVMTIQFTARDGNTFAYGSADGDYQGYGLPNTGQLQFEFSVPANFTSMGSLRIICIPDADETYQWDTAASWGALGESKTANTGSQTNATEVVVQDVLDTLDVSAAVSGIAAGDKVAVRVTGNTTFILAMWAELTYT